MVIDWKDYEYWVAVTQVMLAMVGMGATLTLGEFSGILRRPHGIAFVFLFQYLLCPLLALGLAYVFGLPPGFTLGLLIVATMPSGAMSNIFTYLGKGNLPLSITATTASTLGCLVLTPLVLGVLQPTGLPDDFRMPAGKIIREITLCVLVPLAIGMAIGHRWREGRRQVSKWCIRGCLFFLAILIAGSLTSGQLDIFGSGLRPPAAILLFGALLLGPVQLLAWLLGFKEDDAFTMGIEITMRNCNVALLLKASIWPATMGRIDPIGEGVLYVTLFYGGACLLLCMLPILRRHIVKRLRAQSTDQSNEKLPPTNPHRDDQETPTWSSVA